jgi:hypothetical protein
MPCHRHKAKKEGIICRWGVLAVELAASKPAIRFKTNA